MKSINHSSPDMSESELSVQIRHDQPASPFYSIQFWWYQRLLFSQPIQSTYVSDSPLSALITSSSLLHIQQISESTATWEHSPPLLSSFAIPLVSKILPAITFCKPNFLFEIFLLLFILSCFEWPQFSFNNYINISFKEIFIDSVECKFQVALSGSLFKTSLQSRGYRPQQWNPEIKLDKTVWLTSISNFLRSEGNISSGMSPVHCVSCHHFFKICTMNIWLDQIPTRRVLGSN